MDGEKKEPRHRAIHRISVLLERGGIDQDGRVQRAFQPIVAEGDGALEERCRTIPSEFGDR